MFQKLSETEMCIMEQLWTLEHPVSAKELETIYLPDKKWKIQTISTFLTRMEQKGVLKSYKNGRIKIYLPMVSRQEYQNLEAQGMLEAFYKGSVKNFLVALYSGKISEEKITELENWLNNQKEEL